MDQISWGRLCYGLVLSFCLATPALAINPECLKSLARLSPYGNGWIDKSLVHQKVLESGKEATFYHTYECGNCSRENSMKPNTAEGNRTCAGCGKPHSGETTYKKKIGGVEVVHESDFVTDQAALKSVKNIKWRCSYCNSFNSAENSTCPGCAGSRREGTRTRVGLGRATEVRQQDGREELPHVPFIERQRLAEFTGERNSAASTHTPVAERSPRSLGKLLALAGTGLGAVGTGLWWAFSKHDLMGAVQTMTWRHSIEVQSFNNVVKEDWCQDLEASPHVMPENGRGERPGVSHIRDAGERVHHYDKVFSHTEHYTEEVAYTEMEDYTDTEEVDNGNGTSTIRQVTRQRSVTKYRTEPRTRDIYRDVPRYARWCTYQTYEWQRARVVSKEGVNPEAGTTSLPVPDPNLGARERALPMERNYQIVFSYDQKGKTAQTPPQTYETEQEFLNWGPGESAVIVRRNVGTIAEVRKE